MMKAEEVPASPELELEPNPSPIEQKPVASHTKTLIHFGYFVLVLTILSVVFSLIKVMAD